MAGTSDTGTPVTENSRRALARLRPTRSTENPEADTAEGPSPARRRGLRLGAVGVAALLLVGGSVVAANAHKTVTIDIDGEVTEVSTFAGSVAGLLEDEGVELGSRDVVAPETTAALREGDDVVIRRAKAVTVVTDGSETTVWTTALHADEALQSLAARGEDVRLVASRSGGGGRSELSLPLSAGRVDVRVDGETHSVVDGSVGLATVLEDLDITLADFDRVHVVPGEDAPVVLIQRVEVEERTSTSEVEFRTVTEQSSALYTGESRVSVEGVPGERTRVHRVVLVDGEEESRRLLSDRVTTRPVDKVVQEGTRQRPAPRPAASSSGGSSGGGGGGGSAPAGVWGALAQCESGGNPRAVSPNGLYYGLYQFSLPTWRSVGGSGLPTQASASEQTQRAKALQARSGWGQWPACSAKLGLR